MSFHRIRRAAQPARYQYVDNGDSVSCTLFVHAPGRGFFPLRRATVSKRAVAAMLAGRGPVELAGLWSRVKRRVKKTARGVTRVTASVARKVVDKVVKPTAKAWMKVEAKLRPIGKKIPVVGFFARAHEKYVRPQMERLFGEKKRARAVAKRGTPAQKAEARKRLIAASAGLAQARRMVTQQTAALARTEPKVLARKAKRARARANVYRVITPSGKRFSIPASALR